MPYTELGSSSTLKLKVPTKGTTNWDEELKTNTFQKITLFVLKVLVLQIKQKDLYGLMLLIDITKYL